MMTKKSAKKSRSDQQPHGFVEAARELGLDTDEAEAAFERAFGKIAPPKRAADKKPKPADKKD